MPSQKPKRTAKPSRQKAERVVYVAAMKWYRGCIRDDYDPVTMSDEQESLYRACAAAKSTPGKAGRRGK